MQTVALTPHPLQNTSLPCGGQGVNGGGSCWTPLLNWARREPACVLNAVPGCGFGIV